MARIRLEFFIWQNGYWNRWITRSGCLLRKTTPRKKTVEAIQRWVGEEQKVNYSDSDNKNKEIDDSDNVVNSSNGKNDNEIKFALEWPKKLG